MEIIYTKTDEAPALATVSFLPIVRNFLKKAGIQTSLKDISLAARILSQFSESLNEEQKEVDALALLGKEVLKEGANIIKLPNISASVSQLKNAIEELQEQGYSIPNYPENPSDDAERSTQAKYSKVLGSAVNPVLREGNSDRRVAAPVKEFAKKNPHKLRSWQKDSKTTVASMTHGDFFENEQSVTLEKDSSLSIVFVDSSGKKSLLKEKITLSKEDVFDSTLMSHAALEKYFQNEFKNSKEEGTLLSLHMKATMMKVSDPIIFGYALKTYFKEVVEKHSETLKKIQANFNLGLADVLEKLQDENSAASQECMHDFKESLSHASIAMVNSDKGITNFHFPNDVIIDASMPAMMKEGGKMWNAQGETQDTRALIPDRSYSGVFQEALQFFKEKGSLDVTSLGSVANVGLMAKKAEEYGSHDKTFQAPENGSIQVVDESGKILTKHDLEKDDIWRLCCTRDVSIKDWTKLALKRAELSETPVIFWLDEKRAHDQQIIQKIQKEIPQLLQGRNISWEILAPQAATRKSFETIHASKNIISATGNVLRDYLTDLFPIIELGTSAKMLSIVPLLNGGALFETGAGGSAPKHVEQLLKENHLRWDSLGEFLALAVSLENLAEKTGDKKVLALANALNEANFKYLNENKAPSRKCGEIDNRGSHFFVAQYWATALKNSDAFDNEVLGKIKELSESLINQEEKIIEELRVVQGKSVDLGGYFWPNEKLMAETMRPSQTLNTLIDNF